MPLNISNIRLSVVRLDLVHDFETSSHRKSYLDHILVRVTTPDGLIGWGECASPSGPFYCGETTQTCWYVLHDHLGPALLGREWQHPAEAATMMAHVSGNNFARAGLEMACWDLYGKSRGRSLSDVLGVTSQFVDAGVSLGIEAGVDALLEQVRSHVDEGYRRVKLKIRPGWDVEPVRHVREAFPDLALQVDANTAYTRDDVAHLAGLDPFGLLMIEQPFAAEDLLTHAALRKRIHTPVCLDESITSLAALRTAMHLKACSVVNIKVSRLGGIGAARSVHDECRANGVPVWCGGMHEFGIGRAANLAVAGLPGFVLPSDVSGSAKYYARDVVVPEIVASDGRVAVPQAPGIGVEVDEGFVERCTRRMVELTEA
jgi:O-succinylbenzoate synthase